MAEEATPDPATDPATTTSAEPTTPVSGPEPEVAPPPTTPDPESAPPTEAEPTVPPHDEPRFRFIYQNTLVARLNPLGAEDRLLFMFERRLFAKRHGRLFEGAHFGVGPKLDAAPSIARLGAVVELVPLAILHLRAAYYAIGYFGSQEFKAHPFASPTDEFGPDQIKERSELKEAINTFGGQAEVNVLLQAKVGPIAIRNELSVFNNQIRLPAPFDVFYDLRHDLMLPGKGWFLGDDADLLYINDKRRFTVGARGTYFHVFYPSSVYEAGDLETKGQNDHARVGPLFSYRFKDRPHRKFMRPSLYVLAQWWVKHRYRTGQQVNQAFPLVVIGFSFTGDLWTKK